MVAAVTVLLSLFVLEGVILVLWPAKVKGFIGGAGETTLRVLGVLELILVIVLLFLILLSSK